VPLWSPAKTYCADLGAITAAGEFTPLVRSNIIQTSRAWPAAEVEHRFVSGAAVSSQSEEPAGPQPPPFPSAPAGILEIALRADGSSLAADPPEEEQAGPAVSLVPPPDGGGHAHQATGAPETTPPTGQPRSKPPDAAEILRRTLSEIGEFRQRPPQAHRGAVEGPQAIPPLPATADPPGDLTERAERAFSPGLSSLLPGAQGPKGE